MSGDRTRPPPAHSPPSPSYLGIFTIDVGANGAVEMPPSLLAVSVQTSGCPASAATTLYVRACPTTFGLRPPWRCHCTSTFVGRAT